jgi:hypothetical protein
MTFTRVPGFLPSQSGFHFKNDYDTGTNYPVVTLPLVGTIVSGDAGNGICGGFVLAALDLFRHKPRLAPPPNTDRPAAGSPIFNYLVGRLLDSLAGPTLEFPAGNGARVIEWIHTPGHDVLLSLYGWGLARRIVDPNHGEWPKIKADIDSGVPSPLNLVMGPERELQDITGHIDTLHRCHQVLAYAYEVDTAQNLTLLVYDCNDPTNDDSRISMNIGLDPYHTIPIAAPAVETALDKSGVSHTVRGFFRTAYDLHDPSKIAGDHGPQLSGAVSENGTVMVTGIDANGRIVARSGSRAAPLSPSSFQIQGGMSQPGGSVAVVSRAPGFFDAFVAGTDQVVYTAATTGGPWAGWWGIPGIQAIPGTVISAVSRSHDKLDIFLADSQGRTMSAAWQPGFPKWQGWSHIQGGRIAPGGSVSATSRRPDFLDIFVVGTDGQVDTAAWSPQAGSWQGWWPIAGVQCVPGSPISCVSRSTDKLDIFLADAEGRIMSAAWQPGFPKWQGWAHIRGGITLPGGSVAAISRRPDFLDIFVVGTDGQVDTAAWSPQAGKWQGWWPIAGIRCNQGTPLLVLCPEPDVLVLVATSQSGDMMTTSWSPSMGAWAPWTTLG